MNKLLLDTANLDDIRKFVQSDMIAGVTTNPSLVAKESKGNYIDKMLEIATIIETSTPRKKRHLSIEAISTDPAEILKQSLEFSRIFSSRNFQKIDLYLKIPVTFDNLEIISKLNEGCIKVNATACMTGMQAKMASDAGAKIVSFFYNRIKDENEDPSVAIWEYQDSRNENSAKIICGSIRKPEDVVQCFRDRVEYVTASPKIIREMLVHRQTDKAIAQFQKDIDSWLK